MTSSCPSRRAASAEDAAPSADIADPDAPAAGRSPPVPRAGSGGSDGPPLEWMLTRLPDRHWIDKVGHKATGYRYRVIHRRPDNLDASGSRDAFVLGPWRHTRAAAAADETTFLTQFHSGIGQSRVSRLHAALRAAFGCSDRPQHDGLDLAGWEIHHDRPNRGPRRARAVLIGSTRSEAGLWRHGRGAAENDLDRMLNVFLHTPPPASSSASARASRDSAVPRHGAALADTSLADTSLADTSFADTSLADASLSDASLAGTRLADASLPDLASNSLAETPTHSFPTYGHARSPGGRAPSRANPY